MVELGVFSDGLKEDRAWWLMVTRMEEDGGAVNGGSRHRWPTTWAATRCNMTRGRWRTRSSTQTAMDGGSGGAQRRAERRQRGK
jgi:hypothetical protein